MCPSKLVTPATSIKSWVQRSGIVMESRVGHTRSEKVQLDPFSTPVVVRVSARRTRLLEASNDTSTSDDTPTEMRMIQIEPPLCTIIESRSLCRSSDSIGGRRDGEVVELKGGGAKDKPYVASRVYPTPSPIWGGY